jgi:hypothetical protein
VSDDIRHRFEYHPPQDDVTKSAHEWTRNSLRDTTLSICAILPEGREKALFITKMEEAMFWGNAAIARNQ